MRTEANKQLVRRLVEEVVNERNAEPLEELVAEDDTVVAHLKCSGTQSGEWLGVAPTGRRFEGVDEIYIFHISDGKLASAVGVEDNLSRMRQLGIRREELEAEA